jgi:hypothetical protein
LSAQAVALVEVDRLVAVLHHAPGGEKRLRPGGDAEQLLNKFEKFVVLAKVEAFAVPSRPDVQVGIDVRGVSAIGVTLLAIARILHDRLQEAASSGTRLHMNDFHRRSVSAGMAR